MNKPSLPAMPSLRRVLQAGIALAMLLYAGVLPAQESTNVEKETQQKADAGGERYWNTRWEFVDVDIEKLTRRLRSIGIDTGLNLSGNATVRFEVGVPISSLRNAAAYRFHGMLTSPALVVDGVELRDLETSVNYLNGLLRLTKIRSQIADSRRDELGRVEGRGTMQLVPRGDATAELTIEDVSVAPFADLVAKFLPSMEGRLPNGGGLSGDLRVRAPMETIGQVETYDLEGSVRCGQLTIGRLPPADLNVEKVLLDNGRLKVKAFEFATSSASDDLQKLRLMGAADLPLNAEGEFTFQLAGDDLPLSDIVGMLNRSDRRKSKHIVDGKLDFQLKGTGTLDANEAKSSWKVEGSVASPSMQVADVDFGVLEHDILFTAKRFDMTPRRAENLPDSFKLHEIHSEYQVSDEAVRLDSLDASVFGGRITGSMLIPRAETRPLQAKIAFENMRPTVRAFELAKGPVSASATLCGTIDWRFPIAGWAVPKEHQGTGRLAASEITIGTASVGDLKADFEADHGKLSLDANGSFFGGTVRAQSIANMELADRWSNLLERMTVSQFQFDSVSINSPIELIKDEESGFSGKASGTISLDTSSPISKSKLLPNASVALELTNCAHRSRALSKKISLVGHVEQGVFEIQSLEGDLAGGAISMNGRLHAFDQNDRFHPRADLRVIGTRIKLGPESWFLGKLSANSQGLVSFRSTITGYGDSIRVRGSAEGRELVAYDLPLGIAHSGLVASVDLRTFRWDVGFPSIRSSVGGGQVDGELQLSSSRRGDGGIDIASDFKTRRVDLFRLANQLGRSTSLARGEVSGEMSIRGKSVRSVSDLQGRFNFRLGRTRGTAIPGLVAASQFLGPVSITQQSFDVGEAKGILGQGTLVLKEFWLASDNALIRADGKIYLRSGRMDLNAMIATGNFRGITTNFSQLAQVYALRALLPTSAVLSVTEVLLDRTIVLAVMGTSKNPIVRLRPIETFREEAVRFALREGQRLVLASLAIDFADSWTRGF